MQIGSCSYTLTATTNDPIGRPDGPDSPGEVARGLVVSTGGAYVRQFESLAGRLGQDTLPKDQLLLGLDQAREVWQLRPDGPDRTRALARLTGDRAMLEASPAVDLAGVARSLHEQSEARTRRLEYCMLAGLSLAVVGAFTYISPALTGVALPGAVQAAAGAGFMLGATGAGLLGSMKERPPQLGQLGRVCVYAEAGRAASASRDEVVRIAGSLGGTNPNSVSVTENGVVVGGVMLPRRRSSP